MRDENDALLKPRERLIRLGEVKGSSVRKGAISGWSPDSGFRKSGGTKGWCENWIVASCSEEDGGSERINSVSDLWSFEEM